MTAQTAKTAATKSPEGKVKLSDFDKPELLKRVEALVEAQLQKLNEAARVTRAGATHEEARAENDKDTRGLEASYLARGQSQRVEEVAEAASRLHFMSLRSYGSEDKIGLGALVEVDDGQRTRVYFLVPAMGGLRVELEGREVLLITPGSPLGAGLTGSQVGDEFEMRVGRDLKLLEVLSTA